MQRLAKIPRTRATTAYGLLGAVIRAIEAEPRRVDMNHYIRRPWMGEVAPACGTIGCVAGWACLLTRTRSVATGTHAGDVAAALLTPYGLARKAAWDLFVGGSEGGETYPFPPGRSGTPQYAASVVVNIRHFMTRHARTLKARRLPQTPAAMRRLVARATQ